MNEEQLIQQLRQGNETAFRLLVEDYRNRVFHTLLNIIQDATEAEDTAQDVFIQVFESIHQFKEESSLSTWIYRIAVRKALDKVRRKKAKQRWQHWLPGWVPQEKQSERVQFDHPGITLDNKEKAAVLFKAIESLPGKQKVAFNLIKVQGLTYEEAGNILNQGVKAIESLVSRAKVNLQKQLQNYYNSTVK